MCGQPLGHGMHSAISWGCPPSPTPAPPPNFDPNPCVVSCDGPTPINDPCLTNPRSPACVGVLPPSTDEHCHDSISALGENVPVNTSDSGHTVVNIYTVAASTTDVGSGGVTATGPMGYIYVDKNGQWYLGESPSYTGNAWQVMAGQFGFIGQLLDGVQQYGKNFDEPITPQQAQEMKGSHAGQNISTAQCFTRALG